MNITIKAKDVLSIARDKEGSGEYIVIIFLEGCNGLEGIIKVHNSCVIYIDEELITIQS